MIAEVKQSVAGTTVHLSTTTEYGVSSLALLFCLILIFSDTYKYTTTCISIWPRTNIRSGILLPTVNKVIKVTVKWSPWGAVPAIFGREILYISG